jgi:SAM-dependent methyltransferase
MASTATVPLNFQTRDTSAIDADVEYAIRVARFYVGHVSKLCSELTGLRILEIGPGINFGPQLILASFGAKMTVADRFLAPWDDNYHPPFYRRLRAAWDGPTAAIDAVIVAGGHVSEAITTISEPAESLISVPDGSFDLVLSNAVLEHVLDLPAVCRELARVTRIGGLNSHQIDFRWHTDPSHPLEFLLWDEETFQSSFAEEMGQKGNRWRPGEAEALFRMAGFDFLSKGVDTPTDPNYLRDFIPRLRASRSIYRNWPESDLRTVGVRFVMKRTNRALTRLWGGAQHFVGEGRKHVAAML